MIKYIPKKKITTKNAKIKQPRIVVKYNTMSFTSQIIPAVTK